ncbi:MAG: hypothetical protein M9900_00795 [Flavobacteriales bacterium]|nr:hypothetical protein [Flavobacteriales bacterium]
MPYTKEDELVNLLRGQASIMQEVHEILEQEEKQDELVRASIKSCMKHREHAVPGLDGSRVFGIADIRRICIRFRLRFLPSGRFKGAIPQGAITAVRQLEQVAGQPMRSFMIMAPASRFRLCDCDADPLLFVPVGNGQYYLVHRWGREISPFRAALGWPVRNWKHLAVTALAVAAIVAALVPTAWITPEAGASWWGSYRFGMFFCTAMLAGAATTLAWFTSFGQFSTEAWNSKTFN